MALPAPGPWAQPCMAALPSSRVGSARPGWEDVAAAPTQEGPLGHYPRICPLCGGAFATLRELVFFPDRLHEAGVPGGPWPCLSTRAPGFPQSLGEERGLRF